MDELARRGLVASPLRFVIVVSFAAVWFAACGGHSSNPASPSSAAGNGTGQGPTSPATPTTPNTPGVVLAGAGDIAMCGQTLSGAFDTASLLDGIDGRVFTAGDNTQTAGTAEEFANCFAPTWGRHRARIYPALGNHDYQTAQGAAFFNYFGSAANPPGGYYSYHWGTWHVVVLNSNLPVKAGTPQGEWLRADLAGNVTSCTIAYWHHPLFSSGQNGGGAMRDAWTVLYQYGADVVVNGHDHIYERFGPQDPSGRFDAERGIRQFVVGTGGAPLTQVTRTQPNSERQGSAHGVLKLMLKDGSYDWQFVAVPGSSFSDFGTGDCHQPAG